MKSLRDRLSYSNVVATLALFVALGGGALAAVRFPNNSVGTKQLKNGAVTSAKVKNGSLTGNDINAGSLGEVPDSRALQGHTPADFLGVNAAAANSSHLGGKPPGAYLLSPVLEYMHTEQVPSTGSGIMVVNAACPRGESGELDTAVGGGFFETTPGSGTPGIPADTEGAGFDGTYQLLGSGPAVENVDVYIPAQQSGREPQAWQVRFHWIGNANNPDVTVYVDCVRNQWETGLPLLR